MNVSNSILSLPHELFENMFVSIADVPTFSRIVLTCQTFRSIIFNSSLPEFKGYKLACGIEQVKMALGLPNDKFAFNKVFENLNSDLLECSFYESFAKQMLINLRSLETSQLDELNFKLFSPDVEKLLNQAKSLTNGTLKIEELQWKNNDLRVMCVVKTKSIFGTSRLSRTFKVKSLLEYKEGDAVEIRSEKVDLQLKVLCKRKKKGALKFEDYLNKLLDEERKIQVCERKYCIFFNSSKH